MTILLSCEGESVATHLDGFPLCLDSGGSPLEWVAWNWSAVELDPASASLAFGAGVFIALAFWVAASGIVLLLRSLSTLLR